MQSLFQRSNNKNILFLLVFIFVLGVFLRFYGLDKQSLYCDELYSWNVSHFSNLSDVINKGVRPDVHPPLYQIILYFVEKYKGDSEIILRFPSAVCGSLSILVIFLIGSRLYSNREGLIASAILACSWCPIYYSQEARAYSILLFLALVTTYLWIKIIENIGPDLWRRNYLIIFYMITSVAISYLHYFGIYLIMLQGLYLLILLYKKHQEFIYTVLLYLIILLAYLPWISILWEHSHKKSWMPIPSENILVTFIMYLEFLFNKSNVILIFVLMSYTVYFVNKLLTRFKYNKSENIKNIPVSPDLLLALWLTIPFIGAYIISIFMVPVLTYNYKSLIISLPAAYLLLSRSLSVITNKIRAKVAIVFVTIFILLVHLIFVMDYYNKPCKSQFREAVDYIVQNDYKYENSIIIGYTFNKSFFNYYFEKRRFGKKVDVKIGQEKDIKRLSEILASEKPKYIWYITGHLIAEPEFIKYLEKNMRLLDHKKYYNKVELWLFQRNNL